MSPRAAIFFLLFLASLTLTLSVAVDFKAGHKCTGQLLVQQNATTMADGNGSFVVTYGGKPGDQISCVTTTGLEVVNNTVSTLLNGGPGQRYVVMKVSSKDGKDTPFQVKVFGHGLELKKRTKREEMETVTIGEKDPIKAALNDLGTLVKHLRALATRLESAQKVFSYVFSPLDSAQKSLSDAQRDVRNLFRKL